MGCGLSFQSSRKAKLSDDTVEKTDSNRNQFRLETLTMDRYEVDDILEEEANRPGTYVVYKDPDRRSTFLAFKTVEKKVLHLPIVKVNGLYSFNDYTFPFLESIVLYYKKYKLKETQLTVQAYLGPYITARTYRNPIRRSRRKSSSIRKSKSHEVRRRKSNIKEETRL